jgi:hypothetical protein
VDPTLLGTASAFGLAASAGLNTTLPLFLVGLLARFGVVALASPFNALASDLVLGGLALLMIVEVAGDKVPGVDSVIQLIQWPLAAAAGAILFAGQTSVSTTIPPELAILAGVITAGTVHGARTATRPAVTSYSWMHFGGGNAALSFLEDVVAVVLVVLSVVSPVVAIVLLALLGIGAFVVVRWAIKRGALASRWTWRRLSHTVRVRSAGDA